MPFIRHFVSLGKLSDHSKPWFCFNFNIKEIIVLTTSEL